MFWVKDDKWFSCFSQKITCSPQIFRWSPLDSFMLPQGWETLRRARSTGALRAVVPKKFGIFQKGIQKKEPPSHVVLCFFPHVWGWFTVRFLLKKRVDITWIWVNQNRSPSIATQPMVVVARIFCLFQSEMMVPIGKHILREGPSRNHHSVHHFTGLLVIKHGLLESPPFSSMFFPCTGAHVFFWSPSHVSLPTGISFNFVSSSRRCWIPHEVVPHSLMQKRKAPLRGSDNCV